MRRTLVVCSVAVVVLAGLVGAQIARTKAPAGARAYIISPKNGETVSSTFTVQFGLKGMGVAPAGVTTHSLRWEPGKAAFRSAQLGKSDKKLPAAVTEYDFMSGIPTPKTEMLHINLYNFGYSKVPLQKETEVVIEKFEYFP